MKKIAIFFLFFVAGLFAQQPQTQTAPIFAANAKYVQGSGPGYWPTPGTGLALNLTAGTAFCGGAIQTYAGGSLTMTASVANYVYLNTAASCAPAVSAFEKAQVVNWAMTYSDAYFRTRKGALRRVFPKGRLEVPFAANEEEQTDVAD